MIADAQAWPALRAWFNTVSGFEIGDGVPISPTGLPPMTHLGLHAFIDEALFALLATQTEIPWISVTHPDDGTSALARFNTALSSNSLQLMVTTDPPFGLVRTPQPMLWDDGANITWDGSPGARIAFTDTP